MHTFMVKRSMQETDDRHSASLGHVGKHLLNRDGLGAELSLTK